MTGSGVREEVRAVSDARDDGLFRCGLLGTERRRNPPTESSRRRYEEIGPRVRARERTRSDPILVEEDRVRAQNLAEHGADEVSRDGSGLGACGPPSHRSRVSQLLRALDETSTTRGIDAARAGFERGVE